MRFHRYAGRAGLGAVAAAGALLFTAPAAAPAPSAAPYCGITWGSLAKTHGSGYSAGHLENVRSGRHACFDRLVLDVDDASHGLKYDVRYVSTVHEEGTGKAVPLRGAADLRIIVRVPAYDTTTGEVTYRPANRRELVDTTGYRTFRQAAHAGSFEGQTTLGLGVRGRLPVRVMVLDGPGDNARLVIDVAHKW